MTRNSKTIKGAGIIPLSHPERSSKIPGPPVVIYRQTMKGNGGEGYRVTRFEEPRGKGEQNANRIKRSA